jgi:hypothetical protein
VSRIKKTIILFNLIWISCSLYSQDSAYISPPKEMKYYLTASPLALLEYIEGPNIRIGFMADFNQAFSLTNEFSYLFVTDYTRGFKDRALVKFYLNEFDQDDGRFYLGLQYQYKNNYVTTFKRYSDTLKPNVIFTMHKRAHSLMLVFGKETRWRGRFYIDPFIGLGYRRRNIDITGLEPDEDPHHEYSIDEEDPDYGATPYRGRGVSHTVDFTLGVRLLIKLN